MWEKAFILLVTLVGLELYSQRVCATDQKMEVFFENNPTARVNEESMRTFLTNKAQKRTTESSVSTIPVVVHVIYKTSEQNVSDEQILSQLEVLNNDFRKQNSDFSSVVPENFQSVAADLEIAFCLATKDPDGNTTTGIERKQVDSSFDFDDNYYKSGGMVAWDTSKYLNIWVGPFTDTSLLGWAYLPSTTGYTDAQGYDYDGLCIGYYCFGTMGTAESPYNLGRTATHEIGHYFGLYHIWGSVSKYGNTPNKNNCGKTAWNDYCDDTPATYYPYFGNPTYPDNTYTCNTTDDGAMFMNFMDYSYDASLAMFTEDQKTIVQNAISGPRAGLINANVCTSDLATGETLEAADKIQLYPNPANTYIIISSPSIDLDEVEFFDASGRLVKRIDITNNSEQIDISSLKSGVYYLRTYRDNNFIKSLKLIKK